jgi:hypothetical protein
MNPFLNSSIPSAKTDTPRKQDEDAMKNNVGTIDRVLRATFGLLIGILYVMGELTGTTALLLGIVAAIMLVTSAVGSCPIYSLARITTIKKG